MATDCDDECAPGGRPFYCRTWPDRPGKDWPSVAVPGVTCCCSWPAGACAVAEAESRCTAGADREAPTRGRAVGSRRRRPSVAAAAAAGPAARRHFSPTSGSAVEVATGADDTLARAPPLLSSSKDLTDSATTVHFLIDCSPIANFPPRLSSIHILSNYIASTRVIAQFTPESQEFCYTLSVPLEAMPYSKNLRLFKTMLKPVSGLGIQSRLLKKEPE